MTGGSAARATPFFWVGAALAALLLVALSLWVASLEWFSRDDFRFLAYVQSPEGFSWWRTFLPIEERFWTFYRPLSMETFFWVGHRLFGLEATGYFALSLAFHFASGGLVYRLARELGFDTRSAVATGLLAVSRPGSLGEIYYGSVFMYVGQVFFALVSVTAFLAHLRTGRVLPQVLTCLGLVGALLCNEAAVTTPLLAGWAALGAGRLETRAERWAAARSLVPSVGVTVLYLVFRFVWIAPVEAPVLYAPALDGRVPGNAVALLMRVCGGLGGLGLTMVVIGGLTGASAAASDVRAWLPRVGLGCVGWLATAMAPFALLPFPQGRWAMPLAVPVALLIGMALEASWRAHGVRRPRLFEAALLALVLASFPYATLAGLAADPVGAKPRRIVEWLQAREATLPERAVIVVLYGADGLASAEQGERFRYLAFGGGVLNAVEPTTRRVLRFQQLGRRFARNTLRADSVYLALSADLRLEPADSALLDRHLRRRF